MITLSGTTPFSLASDFLRWQLRGRRRWIAAALLAGGVGLWLGWPLLVVAGVAPILVALAPCALMCTLGYCAMNATSRKSPGNDVQDEIDGCCSRVKSTQIASTSIDAKAKPLLLEYRKGSDLEAGTAPLSRESFERTN